MPPELPPPEVVAVAWLKSIEGGPQTVGTTLPARAASWASSGFVRVTDAGGNQHPYTYLQQSNLQLDAFAYNDGPSQKVPWGRAQSRLQAVKQAVRTPGCKRRVTTPDAYLDAYVHSALATADPRRQRPEADDDMAVYRMDIQIFWTEVAP